MHIKLNVRCEFLGEAKERIRVRRDSQTYLTTEPFFSFSFFFSLGNCFLWKLPTWPRSWSLKHIVILIQRYIQFIFSTFFLGLPRLQSPHPHSHITSFSKYDFMDSLRSYFHCIILEQHCWHSSRWVKKKDPFLMNNKRKS